MQLVFRTFSIGRWTWNSLGKLSRYCSGFSNDVVDLSTDGWLMDHGASAVHLNKVLLILDPSHLLHLTQLGGWLSWWSAACCTLTVCWTVLWAVASMPWLLSVWSALLRCIWCTLIHVSNYVDLISIRICLSLWSSWSYSLCRLHNQAVSSWK